MTEVLLVLLAGVAVPRLQPARPVPVAEAYYLFLEGRILEGQGDVEGALRAYRRAIELQPGAAEIHAELASLYARQGRAAESIDEARRALALDGDSREAHRILGFVLAAVAGERADRAMADEALLHFEKTIESGVRDAAVLLAAGRLAVEQGRHDLAIRWLTSFLLDQSGYPEAMRLLAEAYMGSGRPADAVDVLSDLAKLEPDDVGVLYLLSRAERLAGSAARAVSALEAAVALAPGNQELRFELAAAYDGAGRFEAAERVFRELIAADPAHAGALNYLGYLLADRGERLEEAVSLITRALAVERDNPSYLDSLGWAYFRLGDFARARDPLERAAAALPMTSVVQDHLGDLYFETKRYRDAAGAFDRALVGDRRGIDVAGVTRKRDRARELAGGR